MSVAAVFLSAVAALWLVVALASWLKARWARYSNERDRHRERFLGFLVAGLLFSVVAAVFWVLWAVAR